jgi:hypothetical protein
MEGGLTIRDLGLPSVAAHAAKFAALKQFIRKGPDARVLRPAIAKVFSFDDRRRALLPRSW